MNNLYTFKILEITYISYKYYSLETYINQRILEKYYAFKKIIK